MARAELAKYNALVFQDKKLEEAGVKKGRLTLETRAAYEKKIKELEDALDSFHLSVAGYNKTKAMSVLSVEGVFVEPVNFDLVLILCGCITAVFLSVLCNCVL